MGFKIYFPCVNMREAPDEKSRVVSQALFGEAISILDQFGTWVLIQTPDLYRGWIPKTTFVEGSYDPHLKITRLQAHVYERADTEFGPLLTLPYGSLLECCEEIDARWISIRLPCGRKGYIQKGDVQEQSLDFLSWTQTFLGIPYTWGGRSSFGFDCSGFIQMVYKELGIFLPRDAKDQILDPRGSKIDMQDLKMRDLIFWGRSQKEIKHVGMYLQGEEFIHTSAKENKPFLRISCLSDPEWSCQKRVDYSFRSFLRIGIPK